MSMTEVRRNHCRPEDEPAVLSALLEYFQQRRQEIECSNGMASGARPPIREPLSQYRVSANGATPDYVLNLPRDWSQLWTAVSDNMRKNVRKAYEFLERDGHRHELRVIERPEDVPAALARFFTLHALRASAAEMTVEHPDRFQTPSHRGLLVDYVNETAKLGQLRIFELVIDGAVVGNRLAFVFGSQLYLSFSGFDPAWRKYSVMTLHTAEVIKWAIERGFSVLNLSTGKDQSKLRWKPTEILYHNARQASPTMRSGLLVPTYEALYARFDALRSTRRSSLRDKEAHASDGNAGSDEAPASALTKPAPRPDATRDPGRDRNRGRRTLSLRRNT